MSTKEAQLRAVLGSQTNDRSVHAEALLKVVRTGDSPEERRDLLAIALLERDSVTKTPKTLPNKGITDDRWDILVRSHKDLIDGHLKMAFFKSSTAQGFAAEILHLIEFLDDPDEQVFAFTKSMYSPYVPYQELPGTPVHMSDAEYRHKLDSDENRVGLIDYIIGLPFDERTERVSMLLQVLDDTEDRDLRVALLAHADYERQKQLERVILKAIR